jgi:hypothetical protein
MTTAEHAGSEISRYMKQFLLARIRTLELEVETAENSLRHQVDYKKRCDELERKIKTLENTEEQRLRNRYVYFLDRI